MKRFHYLDALRGYAIAGVILSHSPFSGYLVQLGPRGVQLFFVASAIAITHAWHQRHEGAGPFLIRRAFRICPMFWLAALVFVGLGAPVTGWALPATLLFAQWAHPAVRDAIVPGGWTIAVEISFYVLFPILFARIQSLEGALKALLLSVVIALASAYPLTLYAIAVGPGTAGGAHDFAFTSPLLQLPCFLIGICVYWASERLSMSRSVALYTALAGLIVVFGCPLIVRGGANYFPEAIGFGLVALGLSKGALPILVNRAARGLGLVSYSAYLWHFAVLAGLAWFYGQDLGKFFASHLFALVVSLTLVLSVITYLAVERPMIRVGARVAKTFGRRLMAASETSVASD